MVNKIVGLFTALLTGKINNTVICFIISLFPILELRGGILAASPAFLNVPMKTAIPICIIGNLAPIPFVLLFLEWFLIHMEKWRFSRPIAEWIRKRAEKNKGQIEKYGFWGLVLFVGIPLPGTGAWTGSMVAALLHMKKRTAFAACVLGVLLASVIMTFISYGVLGLLVK